MILINLASPKAQWVLAKYLKLLYLSLLEKKRSILMGQVHLWHKVGVCKHSLL